MSGKSVIPPAAVMEGMSPKKVLRVLSDRLTVAESDTGTLLDQMDKLGIADTSEMRHSQEASARAAAHSHLTNDVLVSRVCKAESAVQTLKLILLRVQSQMELNKKHDVSVEEQVIQLKESHSKELRKLSQQIKAKEEECDWLVNENKKLQDKVNRLDEALEITSSAKSDVAFETEQLNATKGKLQRRINDLRDELSRERSLRGSLEESQNALLTRVNDMEEVIEKEQEQVKTINFTCSRLKQEVVQTKEDLKMALQRYNQAEGTVSALANERESLLQKLKQHEGDKDLLLSEFKKLKQKFKDLNSELEGMQRAASENKNDHESLAQVNKKLSEAVRSAASEKAELVAKHESQIEKYKANLSDKGFLEEKISKLEENLKEKSKEKARLEYTITQLQEKSKVVSEEKDELKLSKVELEEKHKQECEGLMSKLKALEQEKGSVLNSKDIAIEELKKQVERASEEKENFMEENQRMTLEVKALERSKHQMEQENRRLVERIGILEDHQGAQKQVESTMAELTEQKNKLAYDKGRLQSRVDQLQGDLESLASQSMEYVQMKKMNSLLENKLQKTQTQLNSCEMTAQRLETQLKHMQSSGERKEDDFLRVLKARDDVVKEKNKLQEQLDSVEERERQRVQGLQKNVFDAREDNKKMANTLEGLMKTHAQLQDMLEDLQLQLGQRDAKIVQLEDERSKLQTSVKYLETELSDLQEVSKKNQYIETEQVDPLKQALNKCKQDNMKLSSSLEALVLTNSQLLGKVQHLEDELEKKALVNCKTKRAREKEAEDHKQLVKKYEERLENLRQQLSTEREKALKKNNKDLNEVKKKNEEAITRNGELSRANQELRHRISELEMKEKDLQEKLASHKKKIDHLSRTRQRQDEALTDMSAVGNQLHDLEDTKNRYVKKNEEQAEMIRKFMLQINSLHDEFKTLVQNQIETADLVKQQEAALAKERKYNEAMKKKLKETKKREENLEKLRQETENKLKEANDETLNIAHNLDDAHSWFKSKFDSLQTEIAQSKKSQTELELEKNEAKVLLTLEKQRAEETACKARDMIKASRETISRLADYAAMNQKGRDTVMLGLKLELDHEKETSQEAHQQLESSFRHAELLAKELDYLKHKAALFNDS